MAAHVTLPHRYLPSKHSIRIQSSFCLDVLFFKSVFLIPMLSAITHG